jgi:uncharacterized protein (TIGR02246 family)
MTSVRAGLSPVVGFVLLGFILLPAVLAGQTADEQAVREHFERLNAAFESRDFEAVTSLYEEEMVRIPPGEPVVLGAAAFLEQIEAVSEEIEYVLDEYEVRRIDVSGDLAYILATYTEHWTPVGGGEATYSSGRWATMWKRQDDGGWKIAAEIWNLAPEED